MPAGPAITSTPAATDAAAHPAAAEVTARHLRILSGLADIGFNIAHDLEAQIHAATPPPLDPNGPPPHPFDFIDPHTAVALGRASADLALAFARVSRAVRLSIALYERLEREEAAGLRQARAVQPPVIERPAEAAEIDMEQACRESLLDRERLDRLLDRPVEELIALIRADLGLSLSPVGRVAAAKPQTGRWAPILPRRAAPTGEVPAKQGVGFREPPDLLKRPCSPRHQAYSQLANARNPSPASPDLPRRAFGPGEDDPKNENARRVGRALVT